MRRDENRSLVYLIKEWLGICICRTGKEMKGVSVSSGTKIAHEARSCMKGVAGEDIMDNSPTWGVLSALSTSRLHLAL